jgi:hypothetical protein
MIAYRLFCRRRMRDRRERTKFVKHKARFFSTRYYVIHRIIPFPI